MTKLGVKSAVLTGCPPWLAKWAALICRYIESEATTWLPEALIQEQPCAIICPWEH